MGIIFDTVSVISAGTEHALPDLLNHDGLGMAPLVRHSQKGAQQHGDSDLGYRLDPRIVHLLFLLSGSTAAEYWTNRANLIAWFAPYHSPILKLVLGGSSGTRYLDCYHVAEGTLEDDDLKWVYHGRAAVRLKAPDPSFYDPTAVNVTFQIGAGEDTLEIPHPVAHTVGASVIDHDQAINYAGSWYSHPIIQIVGPITDCVITNDATSDKLDFTGTTISAGTEYYIDTRYGQKSVVDDSGTNKIADLTSDSDLGTFALVPDSATAPGGTNSINVTGTGATLATSIVINYYNRYLGV